MTTVLRWGKYKGQQLASVPAAYLEYLVSSAKQTVAECEAELERRRMTEEASLTMVERIVEAGFRELAKKIHPDVEGGDTASMRELLSAREALRERVSEMTEAVR